MRVNFNLRANKPNTKRQPINAVIRWNNQRLVYSTNCKVFPNNWDAKKQRVKLTTSEPLKDSINKFLANFEAVVSTFQGSHVAPYVPTVDELKKHLDSIFAPSVSATVEPSEPEKHTLFSFLDAFIEERREHSTLFKTVVKFNQMRGHLKGFAMEKKRNVDFDNIDLVFFEDFVKYLYSKNLKQNSCNKITVLLKVVLNDATERRYNSNLTYKSRKFNISPENVENVYLSLDELTRLLNYDLADNPRLERVRDLFLIGCHTGLRFSDFTNIKPENIIKIDGNNCLDITTIKTAQNVVIPLNAVVMSIFAKYDGQIPTPLSNQKMNTYVKELCELVGFDESVIITSTRAGRRIDVKYKKCELITTHTARRSFATNAFKAGIQAMQIMRITGHKSETSFKKYIKFDNKENAVLLSSHWFFSDQKPETLLKKVS